MWLLQWYCRPMTCYYSQIWYFHKTPPLNGGNTDPGRLFPLQKKCWPAKKKWTPHQIFGCWLPLKDFGIAKRKGEEEKSCPPPQQFFWTPSKKIMKTKKKKVLVILSDASFKRFSISRMKNCWKDPVGSDSNLRKYMRIKENNLKWNLDY